MMTLQVTSAATWYDYNTRCQLSLLFFASHQGIVIGFERILKYSRFENPQGSSIVSNN
jgi:hypothetical protein